MNPAIQGYAAAVLSELDRATTEQVARELAQVEETILANSELRAAMTDTSVTGPARRAVMAELLASRVSAATTRLAAQAAQASAAQDVPAALAYLAARARHAAQGERLPEPVLSVLGARERVGGYATALYEDLDISVLEEIEDELFRFARVVEGTPALRHALTDRDLPVERRQAVLHQLLAGRVSGPSVALLDYVIAGGRARDVVGTIDWLVDQIARARGWRVAKVKTARALDESQAQSLRDSLTALAGNPVELQVTQDESLLSGVRVEIGDLLVDATARGRLEQLREHLNAEHKTFQTNDH
jgi:F-type H+-transporting ATPase subunit delta